jgi:hypothetical protein
MQHGSVVPMVSSHVQEQVYSESGSAQTKEKRPNEASRFLPWAILVLLASAVPESTPMAKDRNRPKVRIPNAKKEERLGVRWRNAGQNLKPARSSGFSVG